MEETATPSTMDTLTCPCTSVTLTALPSLTCTTWHDFEPAPRNHMVPHYGIFSRYYFGKQISSSAKEAAAYSNGDKNHGPPHFHYTALHDPLEHNELLAAKGITADEPPMRLDTLTLSTELNLMLPPKLLLNTTY